MAKHFFGGQAPIAFQSTPKPGHHHISVKCQDVEPAMEYNTAGDSMLFVTLDDSHDQQSEDSGINMPTVSSQSSPSDFFRDSSVTSPLNARIDEIGKRAQDLTARINESRAMDQMVMSNFEETLMRKVSDMCHQVKEQMIVYYEEHSCGMAAKLQELTKVLENSSQLCMELQGASQTLEAINKGLQQPSD